MDVLSRQEKESSKNFSSAHRLEAELLINHERYHVLKVYIGDKTVNVAVGYQLLITEIGGGFSYFPSCASAVWGGNNYQTCAVSRVNSWHSDKHTKRWKHSGLERAYYMGVHHAVLLSIARLRYLGSI